jgi:hypothetical protein
MSMPRRPWIFGVVVTAVATMACEDPEPAKYRVDVVFPSTAMAIATEDVRFTVFDDPEPGACQRI